MLLSLAHALVRFLADLFLVRISSDAQLRAEVLALRHQLRVLERQAGQPAWQPADRLLLAALSRLLSRSGRFSLLPSPQTLAGIAARASEMGRLPPPSSRLKAT